MGIKIKALTKVKRGTFDLQPGREYELDEKEAKLFLRLGQVELVEPRGKVTETADAPPEAEHTDALRARSKRVKHRRDRQSKND